MTRNPFNFHCSSPHDIDIVSPTLDSVECMPQKVRWQKAFRVYNCLRKTAQLSHTIHSIQSPQLVVDYCSIMFYRFGDYCTMSGWQ